MQLFISSCDLRVFLEAADGFPFGKVAACDTDNHVLLFKHSMVDAQPQADTEEPSSSRTPEVRKS